MDDKQLMGRISQLVDEEHALLTRESRGETSDPDRARMRSLEIQLDQLWDLLRQRRARREFGDDPNQAEVRPPEVVERYEQ